MGLPQLMPLHTHLELHITVFEVKPAYTKLQAETRHLEAIAIDHNLVVLLEMLLLCRLPVDQPAEVAGGLGRRRGAVDAHSVTDLIAWLSAGYPGSMRGGHCEQIMQNIK